MTSDSVTVRRPVVKRSPGWKPSKVMPCCIFAPATRSYNSFAFQVIYRTIIQPKPASQNLCRMLPEKRRRKPNSGRRTGKLHWKTGHADGPGRGMKDLIDGLNRGARDPGVDQESHPSGGVALQENLRENIDKLSSVLHSLGVPSEPRIIGQAGHPDGLAETAPDPFTGHTDNQIAVPALKALVGNDIRVGISPPTRNDAADEIITPGID